MRKLLIALPIIFSSPQNKAYAMKKCNYVNKGTFDNKKFDEYNNSKHCYYKNLQETSKKELKQDTINFTIGAPQYIIKQKFAKKQTEPVKVFKSGAINIFKGWTGFNLERIWKK